jgi:hypothetical protein
MLFIYSYWLFTWFLLYLLNIVPYNPIFYLIIGYILTIFEFIYLILKKTNKYNLIKYAFINIIIKVFPIIILIYLNKYKSNSNDIYIGFILIIFYLLLMIIMKINPYLEYHKLLDTYINNDNNNKTLFSKIYDYIYIKIIS